MKFFLVSSMLVFLASCSCTYQYGVYVKNECDTPISVVFQSDTDLGSILEQEILLQPGAYERIIWTKNINTEDGCSGTKPSHCSFVANYIRAKDQAGNGANDIWCSEEVQFSKTDIQQAEFTLVFRNEDFEQY